MRHLLIVSVLMFAIAGCSEHQPSNTDVVPVKESDTEMQQAIEKARSSSAGFVRAFHEKKPGTKNFCVKKPYATPDRNAEHMWIEVAEESNGQIKGIVANEAESTREVTIGQEVTINIEEISDWMYVDGNKLIGGYTIRYFLDRMSAKQREAFLKQAGYEL